MMKIWMFHHVVKHTSNLDLKTCFYSLCFLCLCAQVLGQRRTPYSNCRRYKWAMQSGQISVTPSCRAQAGHCTFLSDTLVLQEDFQNPFSWVGCLIDVKKQNKTKTNTTTNYYSCPSVNTFLSFVHLPLKSPGRFQYAERKSQISVVYEE